MDIRLIVFGMCFILILLFVGARFYLPREKEKSRQEAQYASAVQKFHKEPTQEHYEKCLREAELLLKFRGKDPSQAKDRLEKDQVRIS